MRRQAGWRVDVVTGVSGAELVVAIETDRC